MPNVARLLSEPLIITEKMDGANVCLEFDAVFSRSHSGAPKHPMFSPLKALHSSVRRVIPRGVQVFGEWLYAQHSIHYHALPNYLMIIGVREGGLWWSWEDTLDLAEGLEIPTVPEVADFRTTDKNFLRKELQYFADKASLCGGEREGLIVRPLHSFKDDQFLYNVGKWVRSGHNKTNQNWKLDEFPTNNLKGEK